MLFSTSRGNIQYSTDAVQWYPHDTGIFLTISADRVVRAWDTNEMEVEFVLASVIWMGRLWSSTLI